MNFAKALACIVCGMFLLALATEASAVMVPMEQVGPQSIEFNPKPYDEVIHVSVDGKNDSVKDALSKIRAAGPDKRYAILVAKGTYNETGIQLKAYVDLFGGFDGVDWKIRDIYQNATVLDGQKTGPVVIGADNARIDGFVITGGEIGSHGAGILCDGVSPTIVNNIITGNQTLRPEWLGQGLGKQIANEGAGIALLGGSRAYVANNLIAENSTEAGNGAGITARGNVQGRILRNVFCNNISGAKDDTVFHGKVGSRSSPGAAIACSEASSPQISYNVMVLCAAKNNNDAGGVWVEGNSAPPINYNYIVGNFSGDDGGGIYVMGNLYYDEAGERHDSSVDEPTNIEDNLIAGNDTGRGGPGGVRVSRWGRVNLRRNLIVANNKGGAYGAEGGAICLAEDNIIADNEMTRQQAKSKGIDTDKDIPASPKIRLSGNIDAKNFDPTYYVTEIKVNEPMGGELAGRVIRIGEQWSIIKSSDETGLIVWGKIDDDAKTFEILDDYGWKPDTRRS